MQYSLTGSLKFSLALALLMIMTCAQAMTPVTIKNETDQYIVDIKYPQGFKSAEVNKAIKKFIDDTQKKFMSELAEDANTPADAPGKTGLNMTYSVPFKSKNALSIRFDVSIYHRGAAHPSNSVTIQNFIEGHRVKLADLFVSGADYLKPIAELAKQAITTKKISDDKWIGEGTKAVDKNYQVWSFSDKGLSIIFNTYQVAAYVYGEQSVVIPLNAISSLLKPKLATIVWGH